MPIPTNAQEAVAALDAVGDYQAIVVITLTPNGESSLAVQGGMLDLAALSAYIQAAIAKRLLAQEVLPNAD